MIKTAEHKVIIKGIYYGNNRTMPCLNDYIHACGKSPHVGGKMKRDYQLIASNAIRKQIGKVRITNPVKIHYRFFEADMRRDPSNLASFFVKVFEDSLQQCGVLPNDGWFNIAGYSQDFFVDKENPRIEVTITEESKFGTAP